MNLLYLFNAMYDFSPYLKKKLDRCSINCQHTHHIVFTNKSTITFKIETKPSTNEIVIYYSMLQLYLQNCCSKYSWQKSKTNYYSTTNHSWKNKGCFYCCIFKYLDLHVLVFFLATKKRDQRFCHWQFNTWTYILTVCVLCIKQTEEIVCSYRSWFFFS